ncbi:DUF3551 domain-containing protein [Pseudorhodoplanes sp.]|uniref:DUF3551 domain-containing protein n=1 Tax=Pseudorhodoplanes sp. TaxID=1934341 RepID=UPI00391D2EA7
MILKTAAAALGFAATLLGGSGPAAADVNYPWCLITGGRGGVMSCGYISYAQCMQTRIGTECVSRIRAIGVPRCAVATRSRIAPDDGWRAG